MFLVTRYGIMATCKTMSFWGIGFFINILDINRTISN
jgi:hypothetical protein